MKWKSTLIQECTQILVRRQPAASDLRMVLAVSRVVRDLERIGDEACKIAIHALEVSNGNQVSSQICQQAIRHMGAEVVKMISGALDAFRPSRCGWRDRCGT